MTKATEQTPLAIIGMACRLPGADDLDAYWQLLIQGRSAAGEMPPDRLDQELYYNPEKGVPGRTYSKVTALVNCPPFDARVCPLPWASLASADIGQLTICRVAAEACRHAGLDPFDLPSRNAGVYLGHTVGGRLSSDLVYATCVQETAEYLREIEAFREAVGERADEVIDELVSKVRHGMPRRQPGSPRSPTAHVAAALVAESLGLNGPAMVLDAACASSMQGLALAARALRLGRIDMAVVGGASHCSSDALVLFSQAQSVTTRDSRPFDADADGLVTGEGFVVLLVKTLARALADGDRIHCVIRGIGVSSDGRGKSLWAPRKEGQIEAIRRAYRGGIEMARLQYVEAHATSTQAGDTVEMAALAAALEGQLPPGTKIPIGSVKANIGHTLETAGLAGLVKTVLAIQRGVIPRQIHCHTLNPSIDWDRVPYFVPTENLAWPAPGEGHARRAAVNAFGIGGLNVHVVLDEFVPVPEGKAVALAGRSGKTPALPARNGDANGHLRAMTAQGVEGDSPVFVDRKIGTVPQEMSPGSGADEHAVAVIGAGCVLPGALNVDAFWDLLASGRDPKCEVPRERWNAELAYDPQTPRPWHTTGKLGGFITDFRYDWRRHKVPPKQISRADPLQFMILDATDAALRDAGYQDRPYDKSRVGVMVGTVFGSEFSNQLQMGIRVPELQRVLGDVLRGRGVPEPQIEGIAAAYRDVVLEHMPALLDETGSFTPSTLASRITKSLDLMGGGAAVNAGHASSLAAIAAAADLLLSGECDMMICAAGSRAMGLPVYEAMSLSGVLSRGSPKAPLDAESDGCVPGEGVVVLVLKRLSDARRDGDRVRGVIRGIGTGFAQSRVEAVRMATRRALEIAGGRAGEVAAMEMTAAGIAEDDRRELQALVEVYGAQDRPQPILVGSLTGQLGVIRGVLGMAAMLKTMLAMEHRRWPRTFGLTQPAPWITDHRRAVQPAVADAALVPAAPEKSLLAAVSCCDGANMAYHLLMEQGANVPMPAASHAGRAQAAARIVRTGGRSMEELRGAVQALLAAPGEVFAAAEGGRFTPADRFRLALVATDPGDLAQKAELAVQHLGRPDAREVLERKGIFQAEVAAQRPHVAFLFPGQGSQYAGMLKALVREFPPAAESLARIDEVLARLGFPGFQSLAWDDTDALGVDPWRTQLALLVADTVMADCVRSLGIEPDRVSGHSYGEYSALVASGAWTFEEAARATRARCAAIEQFPDARGSMVSSTAPYDVVEQLCREVDGKVFVSHENAPDQTVAAGYHESIHGLAERLQAHGFTTRILAVPRPFHTPLMSGVQEVLARSVASVAIGPPRIPILSSVINRYVAEPAEIRNSLVRQMTEPVRYVNLVRQLHEEGIGIFVEVGPGHVLTGLHRKILAGHEFIAIAADNPKRPGLQQLLCVQACLEVVGAMERQSDAEAWVGRFREGAAAGASRSCDGSPSRSEGGPSGGRPPQGDSPLFVDTKIGTVPVCPQVLDLRGTPYDIGRTHGEAQAETIRRIMRRYIDVAGAVRDGLPPIDVTSAHLETFCRPEDLEEMRGIADGAGVSTEAVLLHNLRIHPDSGAGCSHFALTARSNAPGMLHAANEDLPVGLYLRGCLDRNIQARHPSEGIPHVLLGVAGMAGGSTGINAKGLAVSSSMLLDRSPKAGVPRGRLHGVLVKQILAGAEDIDQAIDILRQNPGHGAWGLCLSHGPTDRVCYVEYDGKSVCVQPETGAVAATNHSQVHAPGGEVPAHSQHRLARLKELLGEPTAGVDVPKAQAILRDRFDPARGRQPQFRTMNTLCRVDNQVSAVIQPSEGALWVTHGPGKEEQEDVFQRLAIGALLPEFQAERTTQQPSEQAMEDKVARSRRGREEEDRPAVGESRSVTAPGKSAPAPAAAESGPTARVAVEAKPAICQRFVLRMLPSSLPEGAPATPALGGNVVILGSNAIGSALRACVERGGARAIEIPLSSTAEPALAALEEAWNSAPAPHLILVGPHDADAEVSLGEQAWNEQRARGAMVPYLVAQRWFQLVGAADLAATASVIAVTSLGGDFGLTGTVGNVQSGALAGLVKAIGLEAEQTGRAGLLAKVVDIAAGVAPDEAADAIWREWAAGTGDKEAAYANGRRYVLKPMHQPASQLPAIEPPCGGTWVITGGGRGITAVVARELGRRLGAKLHLVGSSPEPQVDPSWRDLDAAGLRELRAAVVKQAVARGEVPIDAWRRLEKALEIDKNLRAISDAGVRVTYHACDVADRAALGRLLEEIRAADGPIEGIVHGAGVESACRFERKQPEMVARTIAAKVDGAAALLDLTQGDPLRWFVAFGSTSGRFGGVGQTDYCLANEMLCKLIDWHRRRRPECRAVTIQWHGWDEVGMVARPETKHSPLLRVLRFMSTREGVGHLIGELEAGAPESEVLITDWAYCRNFHKEMPKDPPADPPPVPPREPMGPARELGPSPTHGSAGLEGLPMIDAVTEVEPGRQLVAEIHLDPLTDVFLREHRFKDQPMLPIVIGLETFLEAASLLGGGRKIAGLRGVETAEALRFFSDQPIHARVEAERAGEAVQCRLVSDFRNRRGELLQKGRVHLSGTVEFGDPAAVEIPSYHIPRTWYDVTFPDDAPVIYHGPPLRCLRQVVLNEAGGWGRLVAPALGDLLAPRAAARAALPAAVLDGCLFACGICVWLQSDRSVAIPQGMQRLRVGRLPAPDEECLVRIQRFAGPDNMAVFEILVFGRDQQLILQVDGYQATIISGKTV